MGLRGGDRRNVDLAQCSRCSLQHNTPRSAGKERGINTALYRKEPEGPCFSAGDEWPSSWQHVCFNFKIAACGRRSSIACTRTRASNGSSRSSWRNVAGCTTSCWPRGETPGSNGTNRCASTTSRRRCQHSKRRDPRWRACSRRCCRTSPYALTSPSRRSSAA
jgi:hypothetical protein